MALYPKLSLFFLIITSSFLLAAQWRHPQNVAQATVKEEAFGFVDWKQKRVLMAKAAIEEFRLQQAQLKAAAESSTSEVPPSSATDPIPSVETTHLNSQKTTEERIRQLEFNLEIAQGLTIHDYFALYLKDKSKDEMAEAIKKLNADELSELLAAYRNVLYGSPRGERDAVKPLN